MSDPTGDWTIDGVLRPKGAIVYLRGGIFNKYCVAQAKEEKARERETTGYILDPIDLDPAPVTLPSGQIIKVFLWIRNTGEWPFSLLFHHDDGTPDTTVGWLPEHR